MASIQPTSGVTPQPLRPRPPSASGKGPIESGFGETLKNVIDRVDLDQRTSAAAIRDLISGKSEDVLPVVQAVAKADLSFKLLMGVRNKVIEAYKQTMQMQV